MPREEIHEKWARKYGIDPVIAREVSKMVSSRTPHDLGTNVIINEDILEEAMKKYGYNGYVACLLHHALDYIAWWIIGKGPFKKPLKIEILERRLYQMIPHSKRDNMEIMRILLNVVEFIKSHFKDIVKDIQLEKQKALMDIAKSVRSLRNAGNA